MRQIVLLAASALVLSFEAPTALAQDMVVAPASSVTSKSAPVTRRDVVLQTATPDTVAPNVTIAPRRVLEAQLAAQDGVFVPSGYEPVWDDDRLSLTRAHQTYSGQSQMAQFWDNRSPRRLVER